MQYSIFNWTELQLNYISSSLLNQRSHSCYPCNPIYCIDSSHALFIPYKIFLESTPISSSSLICCKSFSLALNVVFLLLQSCSSIFKSIHYCLEQLPTFQSYYELSDSCCFATTKGFTGQQFILMFSQNLTILIRYLMTCIAGSKTGECICGGMFALDSYWTKFSTKFPSCLANLNLMAY